MAIINITQTCWTKGCRNEVDVLLSQPYLRGVYPLCADHAIRAEDLRLFFFEEQSLAFMVLEKMTSDF